jgi:hypothetical protein
MVNMQTFVLTIAVTVFADNISQVTRPTLSATSAGGGGVVAATGGLASGTNTRTSRRLLWFSHVYHVNTH